MLFLSLFSGMATNILRSKDKQYLIQQGTVGNWRSNVQKQQSEKTPARVKPGKIKDNPKWKQFQKFEEDEQLSSSTLGGIILPPLVSTTTSADVQRRWREIQTKEQEYR